MCEKSKKSSPVFWCKACGASMRPKKRKPVTTWEGDLVMTTSVYVKDFPTNEWEDLCTNCRGSIKNHNADLSDNAKKNGWEIYNNINNSCQDSENPFTMYRPVRLDNHQDKMEEECSDLRMDVESRYTEQVYQGLLEE